MTVHPPTSDNADTCMETQVTTASAQASNVNTPQVSADVVTEPTPGTSGIRKCQKRKYNDDTIVQEAYNVMKTLQNRSNERDEHQAFGDYIAFKIRTLKTQHARSTVQLKIHTILQYAEMGHYDEPAQHNPSVALDDGSVINHDFHYNHGSHITDL